MAVDQTSLIQLLTWEGWWSSWAWFVQFLFQPPSFPWNDRPVANSSSLTLSSGTSRYVDRASFCSPVSHVSRESKGDSGRSGARKPFQSHHLNCWNPCIYVCLSGSCRVCKTTWTCFRVFYRESGRTSTGLGHWNRSFRVSGRFCLFLMASLFLESAHVLQEEHRLSLFGLYHPLCMFSSRLKACCY